MAGGKGPSVELGSLETDGIAPSVFAMVERGARLRPEAARQLRGIAEIRFTQRFAPVRLAFEGDRIEVGDSPPGRPAQAPDVTIRGSLPDIVQLVSVPLIRGVPRPTRARGPGGAGQRDQRTGQDRRQPQAGSRPADPARDLRISAAVRLADSGAWPSRSR